MSNSPETLLAFQKNNMDLYLTLLDLLSQSELAAVKANLESMKSFETNLFAALKDNAGTTPNVDVVKSFPQFLQQQTQLLQQLQETALASQLQLGTDLRDAMAAWKQNAIAAMEVGNSATPFNTTLQKQLDSYMGLISAWTSAFKSIQQPRSGKR